MSDVLIRLIADGSACGEWKLDKPSILIGAQSGADIRHPSLQADHARIVQQNGEWAIQKLAVSAPMSFKGYPILRKKLNPGDHIQLGCAAIIFESRTPDTGTAQTLLDEEASKIGRYNVHVLNGANSGKCYHLRPGDYIIGRPADSPDRRIALNDPYISKDHARISLRGASIEIEDLQSTNGIAIENKRVERAEMELPLVLTVGRTALRIDLAENEASVNTVVFEESIARSPRNQAVIIFVFFLLAGAMIAAIAYLLSN
jgi:hypothetical protein